MVYAALLMSESCRIVGTLKQQMSVAYQPPKRTTLAGGFPNYREYDALVRYNRHDSVYLFGAICHARGAAIIMPTVNTEAMNEHLKEISTQVSPGAHAVLVCDASWHQQGKRLRMPQNIALLRLPPYSPELNLMENIWDYLRGNKLVAWSGTATTQSSRRAKMLGTFSWAAGNDRVHRASLLGMG